MGVRPGLAPGALATDPDLVYAGVEDAALFVSADGGQSWEEKPALRTHPSGPAVTFIETYGDWRG